MRRSLRICLAVALFAFAGATSTVADTWHCNCSDGDLVCTVEGDNGEDKGWLHWPKHRSC